MSERLAGEIAYVTGAASGIGFATASLFALEGARVTAVDIDHEGLQKLKEVHGQLPIATETVDISDSTQVADSVVQTYKNVGPISVLVNCAAIFDMQPLDQASDEDKRRSWEVNVAGTQRVTELVAAQMVKASIAGSIVQVGSVSGMGARAKETVYSETKAAILAMALDQARTLGKAGIRVNAVSPGAILTAASQKHAKQIGVDIEDFKKGAETGTIAGRMGTPEEIAKAILFLASADASYITGANLIVDGGLSLK